MKVNNGQSLKNFGTHAKVFVQVKQEIFHWHEKEKFNFEASALDISFRTWSLCSGELRFEKEISIFCLSGQKILIDSDF